MVASVGALAWWVVTTVQAWRRGTAPGAECWRALTLILLLMVASRVLSPQYLIWALGLAALVVANRSRGGWWVGGLLLCAGVLTQARFAGGLGQLRLHGFGATVVVALRNAVLLVAACLALRFAHRASAGVNGAAEDDARTARTDAASVAGGGS
jgi:hypothetical protein